MNEKEEKIERVAVFIDGGNFFHLVIKKLNIKNQDFNFEEFTNSLLEGRSIKENWKRYYIGTVREEIGDKYSKEQVREQNILFGQLKKTHWNIRKNKLRTRLEKIKVDDRMDKFEALNILGIKEICYKRKREKGIDVMIAMDMLIGAIENSYDTAILISSDTDILPVVDYIQNSLKKKVEYIGFDIKDIRLILENTIPTMSLSLRCRIKKIFNNEGIEPFIIKE